VTIDPGAADVIVSSHLPASSALGRLRSWGRSWAPAAVVSVVAAGLLVAEPGEALTTFATVFLGIFFEALPFLLLGVLVSAALQAVAPRTLVGRLVPGGRLRGALAGGLLGTVLPVCECGVVPVARRLLDKGAPLPAALGFLLAGPAVNPVVFAATWTAFGPGLAAARLLGSLLVAVAIAWLYALHPRPASVLREAPHPGCPRPAGEGSMALTPAFPQGEREHRAAATLMSAGDELLEMGRYLVLGAAAAAVLRTLVPGPALLALGQGPVVSVALMMVLAALLSICSVVDAFVALSLSGPVSSGAILAFLIFGPVVDLKSVLLYGAVFRWRTVAMMVLLLTQLVLLIGVAINLNVG
jgi:uncharacterized membrane protein YraQ (UPF0718 family)